MLIMDYGRLTSFYIKQKSISKLCVLYDYNPKV